MFVWHFYGIGTGLKTSSFTLMSLDMLACAVSITATRQCACDYTVILIVICETAKLLFHDNVLFSKEKLIQNATLFVFLLPSSSLLWLVNCKVYALCNFIYINFFKFTIRNNGYIFSGFKKTKKNPEPLIFLMVFSQEWTRHKRTYTRIEQKSKIKIWLNSPLLVLCWNQNVLISALYQLGTVRGVSSLPF